MLWLRRAVAQRKWIVWVAALLVIVAVYWVAVTLFLPHRVLSTLRQFEEAPNALHQLSTQSAPAKR